MIRKRFIIALVVCLVAFGVTLAVNQKKAIVAVSESILSSKKSDEILGNCQIIKRNLNKVHVADALSRVNQGQVYESLQSNLIAPFNDRLSNNSIDATNLRTLSDNYQNDLADYRRYYQDYEQSLSETIDINCQVNPSRFYSKITDSSKKRQLVGLAVGRLLADLNKYDAEISKVESNIRGEAIKK